MGDKTSIEWTRGDDGTPGATWNPTTGCDQVSPGCDNCYALTMAKRLKGMRSKDYQNDGDPRTSGPGFAATMHPHRLGQPLRWKRPRRIFVNSMSDLFHEAFSDDYIALVFTVMAQAPQHTFQVLTKRHGRMRSLLSSERFRYDLGRRIQHEGGAWRFHADAHRVLPATWPLPNVWLGVSVEDQKWADIRIPALLDTPAAVRFLSCEPLLGPIDLDASALFWWENGEGDGIHWVIAGGESGPGARPMDPEWARSLRDQCTLSEVAFHFKQWGEWVTEDQSPQDITLPATSWRHLGEDEPSVYKVGKHAAGRELDGRTWDEYPDVAL